MKPPAQVVRALPIYAKSGLVILSFLIIIGAFWGEFQRPRDDSTVVNAVGIGLGSTSIIAITFVTGIVMWITCCGAGRGGGGGGGGEGSDRIHRVYPPSVVALGAILPSIMMALVGAVTGGTIGFLVGLAIGSGLSFGTLLYLLSSPEYSSGLIDL